ncbi:coiled-coil domain-containing protein 183 isoform X6 [Tympanuchus pallidicinctus]|uniref:coiled-coil domain-containing protein 183 isoform X6 n=1 Tax=Tympanuchus pallidicinctus TaxID=109042 RepID=UPI00228709E2|nr:coiled-coil domain-containing protein 183 isoform X6 [Tympanuchus pallidicinctus]
MQGRRADMNQQIQELRNIIALQEQGKKFSRQLSEEKHRQNKDLLSRLHGRLREDIHALDIAQKHDQRIMSEFCRAQKYLCGKTVQGAREKLRSSIFDRVNACNMLLHEVKQRSQARDALRWQLQQLLDVRINDKRHQEQVQMIRQLENNIEKMHMKIHAGQKVTTLYLALRDVLKKELDYLLLHLELLYTMVGAYHGEVQDRELMASGALRASDITKKDLAMLETRFLAEEEDRHRILSARKVQTDWLWLKEASKKHSRAQARYDLAVDFPSLLMQDSALGSQLQATRSQIEHESFVTAEVEKAKAAVQCSRVWDITSRLLAQQKSTAELEQHIRACKEKRRALKDTLQELELKHAKLKFHQPPSAISCRKLEAELRVRLQQEEARLEQARAQYVRNQELLLQFENGLDNLIVRLHGINVPEQDLTVEFKGVDEKLQHCRQKLQHLAQRVSSLPAHSYSPDEDNETFVKVRNLMEKTTAGEPWNLKIPLEDIGSGVQAPSDFVDEDHDPVPTREDIKKQGLSLIESRMRSSKRK